MIFAQAARGPLPSAGPAAARPWWLRKRTLFLVLCATLGVLSVVDLPTGGGGTRGQAAAAVAAACAATAAADVATPPAAEPLFSTSPSFDAGATLPVCVLVRTYEAQANAVPALLASLFASGHPSLTVILADTGQKEVFKPALERAAAAFNALVGRPGAVRVAPHTHSSSRARVPKLAINDFGYVITDLMLEDVLTERAAARAAGASQLPCEVLMFTNGDNVYSSHFLGATGAEVAERGAHIVATHFVTHYGPDLPDVKTNAWAPQMGCGAWRAGRDVELIVRPDFRPGCVDLASVALRASVLEETGWRFVVDSVDTIDPTGRDVLRHVLTDVNECIDESGKPPASFAYCADGILYKRIAARKGTKVKVLRRALLLHQ